MTENRFYNYDDALKGMVEHLTLVPTGEVRNLPMLVIYGGKPVESYKPLKASGVADFMENNQHLKRIDSRLALVQETFGLHFYPEAQVWGPDGLNSLDTTVIIDDLKTYSAPSIFRLIQDTFTRIAEAKGLSAGKVFLFIVKLSV